MAPSNAARLRTTRLCSTATRRASISSAASSSLTVSGPERSNGSPFSIMVTVVIHPDNILSHIYTRGLVSYKDQGMALDQAAAVSWYRRNRERSRALFDMLPEQVYFSRPIALRHPIVFYEGHLPGFSFNTLVKKALGGASIDPRLENLFARGIDPSDDTLGAADSAQRAQWPDRDTVRRFTREADR